ncbi:unnamed protein product [Arctia plantaginis]|uniref:Uncharacterized protein n=1 Tax=Arctia plantaginis TaxID=874455 RepID=A0A8S0ZUR3_ARCPL|nr:unnamed protein product [Arctia plantaginis]
MPDKIHLEQIGANDPSLPSTAPSNVQKTGTDDTVNPPPKSFMQNFYNRETKQFCGRTCESWGKIIAYGIIYLLFLCTYTLVILYLTLLVIKQTTDFKTLKPSALVYPLSGIGLTAIPTSESTNPLIWYRKGEKSDYNKYIKAIEKFLFSNSNNTERVMENLGPCGRPPYGYGENPCIIIKINKHFYWSGKPLQLNTTNTSIIPPDVIKWMMIDKNKLWVECSGYHAYDKEHIGSIKYYPNPPGIDSESFPLYSSGRSHLIAIQISDFTMGVSLAIQCKLWYESGPSVIDFVLYVAPTDIIAFSGLAYFND